MFWPATVFSATLRWPFSLAGKDGAVLTDWRAKVRLAIGSVENLPVPLMLAMVPCGEVSGF